MQKVIDYWQLLNWSELERTPYSIIYSAYSTKFSREVVVKIANSSASSKREAKALKDSANPFSVRLLDYMEDEKAALLERVIPGTTLSKLFPKRDDEATKILCNLIANFPKKINDAKQYQTLGKRLSILKSHSQRIEQIRKKARDMAKDMLKCDGRSVFLHGDLHHDNILLDAHRGYIAIDPKGILGDEEYEVAAFMCNPINPLPICESPLTILENRVNIISEELGFLPRRIRKWTYIHAAAACLWAEEDGLYDSKFFDLAGLLEDGSFF